MNLVTLNSLQKSFGAQLILSPISLEVNSGDHISLVGRNGVGKTTLLRMITGLEEPSAGHIIRSDGVEIGYLAQDPEYPRERTLYEEVREGIAALDDIERELRQLEERFADPKLSENKLEHQQAMERYALLHDRFEARDGWKADARVEAVLDGLKIPRQDWHREVSTFSGGERNVVGLARILVRNPGLMLLDEPGNHLDFEGLDWLENVLGDSNLSFILVSHNRYLLDNVCTKIWEFEFGKIEVYKGNYSAYRAEKLLRMEKVEAALKRQQRERERLLFQVQRLKSWASVYDNPKLARTAKRFERRIEKMKPIEKIRDDRRTLGVSFQGERTRGDIALDVKNYNCTFGNAPPLIKDATFRICQGERVALVGANGTGKTTLFSTIVREGRWENETLRVGKAMRIGYFSQLGETLETKNSLLYEMMRLGGLLKNEAESMLHRFLFTRDDIEKPVSVLSGGEKARLQLAGIIARHPNFLLLDEPTNHLDIQSRETVEDALEEFEGTLFVISHDRYFLDKMVERVLYIAPPKIVTYEGNFSDFWSLRKEELQRQNEKREQEKRRLRRETKKEKQSPKIRFDAKRFLFLEHEIERLENNKRRLLDEVQREHKKGNEKRKGQKLDILEKTEIQLNLLYEEWFTLGDRK